MQSSRYGQADNAQEALERLQSCLQLVQRVAVRGDLRRQPVEHRRSLQRMTLRHVDHVDHEAIGLGRKPSEPSAGHLLIERGGLRGFGV